jgi:hypothetical protein
MPTINYTCVFAFRGSTNTCLGICVQLTTHNISREKNNPQHSSPSSKIPSSPSFSPPPTHPQLNLKPTSLRLLSSYSSGATSSPPVCPAAALDTTSHPIAALDGGSPRLRCAQTTVALFHGVAVALLHGGGGGSAPLRSAATPRPLLPPWPCQPTSAARPRAPTRLTISSSTSSAALVAAGGV